MKIPRIIRVLMRGICFRYAKKIPPLGAKICGGITW